MSSDSIKCDFKNVMLVKRDHLRKSAAYEIVVQKMLSLFMKILLGGGDLYWKAIVAFKNSFSAAELSI